MLLCVFFGLTNQVCNYFEFLCKTYFVFENFKGECLKILNLGKLGLKLVFSKNISSHTHAFYSLYLMLWGVFSKTTLFLLKCCFSDFWLIQFVFRSIEIVFKISGKPLSISINQNWFSINQNSWIRFKKIRFDLFKTFFQKFFKLSSLSLSLSFFDSARLHSIFFVVFPLISCKVFLSISQYVHYTLSFSFIFCFTCNFFIHWRVIFGLCINWGFWCFKPNFVKLVNGFCWYIFMFMI